MPREQRRRWLGWQHVTGGRGVPWGWGRQHTWLLWPFPQAESQLGQPGPGHLPQPPGTPFWTTWSQQGLASGDGAVTLLCPELSAGTKPQ